MSRKKTRRYQDQTRNEEYSGHNGPKCLEKRLGDLKIRQGMKNIQATALLENLMILRRVSKIWEIYSHSGLSEDYKLKLARKTYNE